MWALTPDILLIKLITIIIIINVMCSSSWSSRMGEMRP